MSNPNFYKGFNNEYSYKLYRSEVEYLETLIYYTREDEEREQIPYWLKRNYDSIRATAIKTIGYIRCLWDFDMIDEETFDKLYDVYSQMAREAEERIDELSEQE